MQELLDATLLGRGTEVNTWYLGANIPGKAHSVLFYFGGAAAYFKELKDSLDGGLKDFKLAEGPD